MARDIIQPRELRPWGALVRRSPRRASHVEDQYFLGKEFALLEKLKAVFQKKVDKESISKATGVMNEQVLDRLVSMQLNGEVMAAFQLYPLVEIAWADGNLSESEAKSVLAAGEKQGVRPGSRAYRMLEDRLHNGPDPEARKIWFLYAEELKKVLSPQELEAFRDDLLERARGIVAATGHVERLVFNVGGERKILAAVKQALTPL
jgi:hypothetical protein